MSTVDGFKLALRRHTISPALEKILSDGVEVPGIPKYFSTNVSRWGYRLPFSFHHSSGLVLISGVCSCVYRITSSMVFRLVAADWSDDSSFSAAVRRRLFELLASSSSFSSSLTDIVDDAAAVEVAEHVSCKHKQTVTHAHNNTIAILWTP